MTFCLVFERRTAKALGGLQSARPFLLNFEWTVLANYIRPLASRPAYSLPYRYFVILKDNVCLTLA
jgi:hypothetical protein